MTSEPDCLIRLNTVLERTGLSRSTLNRKIADGTFPRQLRISDRCVDGRESAVIDRMRNPMFYRDQSIFDRLRT